MSLLSIRSVCTLTSVNAVAVIVAKLTLAADGDCDVTATCRLS